MKKIKYSYNKLYWTKFLFCITEKWGVRIRIKGHLWEWNCD